MRLPLRFAEAVCLVWLLLPSVIGQTVTLSPKPDSEGVYQVAEADLRKFGSSPPAEFPRELSAYEIVDKVVIAVSVSPEGKVKKAKAVSGKVPRLKETAENTVKKWVFQPYLVDGMPVPARTEITFNFDNSFDHYRDMKGDSSVHLDEAASRPLIAKRVPPQYPYDARNGRIQGSVELRGIVDEDGRVQALHIIRGHPMLAPAAFDAVRQWEFKPYIENGKALSVDTEVTVNFTLSG